MVPICFIFDPSNVLLTLGQIDKLFGLAMLIIATTVFLYYTVWTLLMVWSLLPPTIEETDPMPSHLSIPAILCMTYFLRGFGRSEFLSS